MKRVFIVFFCLLLTFCSPLTTNETPKFLIPPNTINSLITFFTFGDWGTNGEGQHLVAESLRNFCATETCAFGVLLGDNFYNDGVESIHDSKWETHFKQIYRGIEAPFYAALGNHDYDGNAQAQIDYTNSQDPNHNPQWILPARQYKVPFFSELADQENPLVELFVLDSDELDPDQDIPQLERELDQSTALFKLLVLHHPIYSNGKHGDTKDLEDLIPVICRKVDLVLSGHDHNFEHIQDTNDGCWFHQIVAGTGGRKLRSIKEPENPRSFYSESAYGFVSIQVNEVALNLRFHRTDGTVPYSYTIEKF